MKEIQSKMMENISNIDADSMMKTWMPEGMKGLDQMQNMHFGRP